VRDLTYPPIIAACKTAFRLLGQDIRITGAEHVPRQGTLSVEGSHERSLLGPS
jgi:hypothetical protein